MAVAFNPFDPGRGLGKGRGVFAIVGQPWWRSLLLALTLVQGSIGIAVVGRAGEVGGMVPALKGDGIYSLLRRHGLDPEGAFQDFVKLNRDRLGKDNMLMEGRRYVLPGRASTMVEPLFGTDRARVERQGDELEGAVFYLVSGHGGPDPGGMGQVEGHTLCEDEYAYDVTLRLGRRLMEHGAKVYFIVQDRSDGIRDDRFLRPDADEVSYGGQKIPANQRERLRQRTEVVNALYRKDPAAKYKRCLTIHVDARRKAEDIDIFFYYQQGNALGRRLALTMRNTIRDKYRASQPGRGYEGSVTTRELYVLRNVEVPLVFVELGNIHHVRDQQRLLESNNRQAVANWLFDGVLADFRR